MALYIFVFHSGGLPVYRAEQEFADDAEAIKTAAHLSRDVAVDVWLGERVLAELPKGAASRPAFSTDAGNSAGMG